MRCPHCQHENPPQAKFCVECAAPLAQQCANCGAPLPAYAKFCPECAHPVGAPRTASGRAEAQARFSSPQSYTPRHLAERILTSKSALEGERKQVTVLFADLKGSMELLADRDPEEARKLLDPVLERMMEAVHRYEGTVNQVMGDGIMALFGAPVAHEDHATRACYAALRMQESVKKYAEEVRRSHVTVIKIRVGLNSGEVVVRAIGSDLHMDYTAVGQTTHLAARMEQLAEPGSILLSPATLKLAEGYVVVKPLGPLPVKGLPAPVEVSELIGAETARSRLHAAAARGLTRFVGRNNEVDQLRQALERAESGHGQVVAVIGEPGVGKSRLYWEFIHSHRMDGRLVLESGSVSYGKATAYLPVIQLLKGYFQIEGRDETRTIREKVTGKVRSLDRDLEPCLPALLSLLEVPGEDEGWKRLDPPLRRQRTLDAIKRLLLRESRVQPLLLLFEDLHWIDGETQALLDSLVESLPKARLLLLTNYRPEYRHGWASKTYYRQLHIESLPAQSVDDLLTSLLGTDPSLESLKRTLVERTEGNPLFLEESVRALAETKALLGERGTYRLAPSAKAVQIPATVQAILAARVDRLSPEDKRQLQAASVVGKDVSFALLLAIAELGEEDLRRRLAHLQAAEFLYEASLFPDLEYTFKHALTHEVTYSSLLQDRRRDLHARLVDAIERLYRDRLDEHPERLAHHAVRGELWTKALHYLRQAGRKAWARSALQDARVWFEQALGVLAEIPESAFTLEQGYEIRFELRPVLIQFGEGRQVLERLREAETFAERLNDDRRRGRVCAVAANAHVHLGEFEEALAAGTRALEIAGRLGDLQLRLLTTTYLEQVHYQRSEFGRVVELATENLAALPADWVSEYFGAGMPIAVYDRFWLVMSLAQLGRFTEIAPHDTEMIRRAELMEHAYSVGMTHWAAALPHRTKGEWATARSLLERGIDVLRMANTVVDFPFVLAESAWVLAQLGEQGEALTRFHEAVQLAEGPAKRAYSNWAAYRSLGRAALLLGRLDEARSLGERAIECFRRPGFLGHTAHVFHLLGDIATHRDRFAADEGESHYREALALAEPRGMRPLVAQCHLGFGKLYRRTGNRLHAREHLTIATRMLREIGMQFWLEQADATLGELA